MVLGDVVNLTEGSTSNVIVQCAWEPKVPNGGLLESYQMMSNPRGYALIINNVYFNDEEYPTRNGAHNDERAMGELLRELYFQVEIHRDKTKQVNFTEKLLIGVRYPRDPPLILKVCFVYSPSGEMGAQCIL